MPRRGGCLIVPVGAAAGACVRRAPFSSARRRPRGAGEAAAARQQAALRPQLSLGERQQPAAGPATRPSTYQTHSTRQQQAGRDLRREAPRAQNSEDSTQESSAPAAPVQLLVVFEIDRPLELPIQESLQRSHLSLHLRRRVTATGQNAGPPDKDLMQTNGTALERKQKDAAPPSASKPPPLVPS